MLLSIWKIDRTNINEQNIYLCKLKIVGVGLKCDFCCTKTQGNNKRLGLGFI